MVRFPLLFAMFSGAALAQHSLAQQSLQAPPSPVWDKVKGDCPASLDWTALRGKVVAVTMTEDSVSPDDITDWNEFAARFEQDPVVSIRVVAGSEFLLDQALSRSPANECILFDSAFANTENFKLPHYFPRTVVVDQSGLIAGYTAGEPDEETVRSLLNDEPATGLESTPPQPRSIDSNAGREYAPSFEVHISSAAPREPRAMGTDSPDRYIARNQPLNLIVMDLWNTPLARIAFPELLDKGSYDVAADLPVPDRELLLKLTREAVSKRFGLVVEKQRRTRPVYVLRQYIERTWDRTPQLQPAAANDSPPMSGGSETSIIGTAQPAEEIAKAFEGFLDTPVIDETGLKGTYDYSASSKKSGSAGALDMARQLGLDIQLEERTIELLMVSREQ